MATAYTYAAVPAPVSPLIHVETLKTHTWNYPFVSGQPAGVIEVSNTVINREHKLGTWSEPVAFTVDNGWQLYGGAWNQWLDEDVIGIAWKVKVVSLRDGQDFPYNPYQPGTEHYYTSEGWHQQTYYANKVAPYSSIVPKFQLLGQDQRKLFTLAMFNGGVETRKAPAPPCYIGNIPYETARFAWCRVAETGETELSTPVEVKVDPFNVEVCTMRFMLGLYHPQGTIGYHIYRQDNAGAWRRIPTCAGVPTKPDDWLFDWSNQMPVVHRWLPDAPIHKPAAKPQSRLTKLHRAMQNHANTIVVNDNEVIEITCPLIDEWGSAPTGNDLPHKFYRHIKSKNGTRWILKRAATLSGHERWPMVGIYNSYSTWTGCEIQGAGGDGIHFSDFQGGKAFGNRFINCTVRCDQVDDHPTVAIKVSGDCGVSHTASELQFVNTGVLSAIPIWLGGNQTANVIFDRTHAASYSLDDRGSVVYLENPNIVKLANGFFCDAYVRGSNRGTIFRASVCGATLHVDDIWVDAGYGTLVDACGVRFSVKFNGGKLNNRGLKPILARYTNNPQDSYLVFDFVDCQLDPGVLETTILNSLYAGVYPQFRHGYPNDFSLKDFARLQEPTQADVIERQKRIWPSDPPQDFTKMPATGIIRNDWLEDLSVKQE